MQLEGATKLERSTYDLCLRVETELPASELSTSIVACLSLAGQELQRLRVEQAVTPAKDYEAWCEIWDIDMCLSEIEMMVTRVRRHHNERNAARARPDAYEELELTIREMVAHQYLNPEGLLGSIAAIRQRHGLPPAKPNPFERQPSAKGQTTRPGSA